jgi:ABC-type multidrug transport system permease subunit
LSASLFEALITSVVGSGFWIGYTPPSILSFSLSNSHLFVVHILYFDVRLRLMIYMLRWWKWK